MTTEKAQDSAAPMSAASALSAGLSITLTAEQHLQHMRGFGVPSFCSVKCWNNQHSDCAGHCAPFSHDDCRCGCHGRPRIDAKPLDFTVRPNGGVNRRP